MHEAEFQDWRQEWLNSHAGHHVELLVGLGELGDDEFESVQADLEAGLQTVLAEPSLESAYVDPSTGASGYGIGFIWEILGRGADLFAWMSAAALVAGQLRKAAAALVAKLGKDTEVFFSAEAIKVLCVAEVLEAGAPPQSLDAVNVIEHKYIPSEATVEKQQLNSAYTVTISGAQSDGFYHVWSFLVTCHARVVARNTIRIPMPNSTHWFRVDLPTDKLRGLP